MSFAHRLVIVRHAKAAPSGPSDFERPLTDRGVLDADSAGVWLRDQGLHPQVVLVSAARRTQETWRALSTAAGWGIRPTFDRGLYAAGSDTVLDLLRLQDEATRTVVVIGHNPTMSYLAQMLDDGEGEPELAGSMVAGFPTSALAVFGYEGSWSDLATGTARLTGFHVGRSGD